MQIKIWRIVKRVYIVKMNTILNEILDTIILKICFAPFPRTNFAIFFNLTNNSGSCHVLFPLPHFSTHLLSSFPFCSGIKHKLLLVSCAKHFKNLLKNFATAALRMSSSIPNGLISYFPKTRSIPCLRRKHF